MTVVFDNAILDQIKQANDIVDLVSEYISLRKKGREMIGLCPFHDDHSPSLNVSPVKQIFMCFACGTGGDIFKFVQLRENLTFPQAVERLAQRGGIKLEKQKFSKTQTQPAPPDIDPNTLARLNNWAADYFQKNLNDPQKGQFARDYIDRRKITKETAKNWRFGLALANDDLLKTAEHQKISTDLLSKAGLITYKRGGPSTDKFVNRLMFPITDVTGRVIAFGGRTLDNADAKYINSPTTALFDKSNSIYGLEQARHHIVSTNTAVVVEGYTDCIMAHQYGCNNVVAALGTSFTIGHSRILKRYAKKVVLIFDSDAAGISAANRALEVCLSQYIDIKLTSVSKGKDPCDFLLLAGKDGFEELVENATDIFEFKWNRLKENLDKDTTFAGNKAAIEEFLTTIATAVRTGQLPAIERGLLVNKLSRVIGLEPGQINNELAKRLKRAQTSHAYSLQNQKVQSTTFGDDLLTKVQREILEVILNAPDLFETVSSQITPEDFGEPLLRKSAVILFETLTTGTYNAGSLLSAVLNNAQSVELGNLLTRLAHDGEQKGNFQPRLTDALKVTQRIKKRNKNMEIEAVKDPTRYLRNIHTNTPKQNRHNLGMV